MVGKKYRPQRVWRFFYATLPILVCIAVVLAIVNTQEPASARTRDLVATPALMGSPLQVIESRMSSGQLQRFESRMLDSPLQLIGSPFGPYRFATLPNLQDLRATRRSISALPAMFQVPRGVLLLLPYYVVPFATRYVLVPSAGVTEEANTPPVSARPAAAPKFFSARCGQFVEIAIPVKTNLTDEETKPC
jgi:hypothetical protein